MDLEVYYETIKAYIKNTLSGEERSAFEQEMGANPGLKAEVVKHILAKEAVGILLEDKIRANLEKVVASAEGSANLSPGQEPKVRRLFTPVKAAAAILFMAVSAWLFFQLAQHNTKALTAHFYQEATTGTLMGAGSTDATIEKGQLALLKEKDAGKAVTVLSKIPEGDPNYITARYYLGHAYFLQKDYSKSAEAFEYSYITKDLPEFIDRQEVQWNWLLAKLGAGADTEVETTLDMILKNKDNAYYKKATELKKKLNSVWR